MYLGDVLVLGRTEGGRKAVLYSLCDLEGEIRPEDVALIESGDPERPPGAELDESRVRVKRRGKEYDIIIGSDSDKAVFLGNGDHVEGVYREVSDGWGVQMVEDSIKMALGRYREKTDREEPRVAGMCDALGSETDYFGVKAGKSGIVYAVPDPGLHYLASVPRKGKKFTKKGSPLQRIGIAGEEPRQLAGNFMQWLADTAGTDFLVCAIAGMYRGGSPEGHWVLALERV